MGVARESNFVSNVVYLGNNETNILLFIRNLYELMDRNFEQYEFIFINDDSNSDNISLIKDFFEEKDRKNSVTLLNMGRFQGIEAAMAAGIDIAIGDYIFEYDTVFVDYESNLIMDLYYKCVAGKDIVTAVPKGGRNLLSEIFYFIYNHVNGEISEDINSETFCIVSRRAINRVNAIVKTVPYRKALYASCGLPIENVKYERIEKPIGKRENKKFEDQVDLAINTFILFTNVIEKSTLFISIFFLSFSLLVGIYVCVMYFGIDKPVEGWAPLMGFLSATFSGVFLIFAIIIKYLTIILNMIFVKEKYKIESVEKL